MVARGYLTPLFAAGVLALVTASSAAADSASSTNWSGYIVHRDGLKFHGVSAVWRQPSAVCTAGQGVRSSSTWVGLGGYSRTSSALEQIGTALDCTNSGRRVSSAWYESLPNAAKQIKMTVNPGDQIFSGVTASGQRVTVRLSDLTRKEVFTKTLRVRTTDVTSAEWIVEAPTWCGDVGTCGTLPLTNFGSFRISGARAETRAGRWGRVASSLWRATRVILVPDPLQYNLDERVGIATPSRLDATGASFAVDYSEASPSTLPDPATRRGANG